MSGVVRPIRTGWVVTGGVPGPDVDEFAEADQVVAALATTGADTLLAVQHPHRTRAALAAGLPLTDALPTAQQELARLLRSAYREVGNVVAPYLVSGHDGTALGMLCLVDPAAVDVAGQARVRQAEQVYPDVVAERAAVLAGLGVATSAALLVPVTGGDALTKALWRAIDKPAEVSIVDSQHRQHALWLVGPGPEQDELVAIADRHPLLVADGNHRVAAAAASDPSSLLALVTAGPDLRVGAIHRVLTGTGRTLADLTAAWRAAGLDVVDVPVPTTAPLPGTVIAVAGSSAVEIKLPPPLRTEALPRIDHGVVEQLLIGRSLGIDPEGPQLRPLPAGISPATDVDAVLLLAAVPYPDVLAVHEQGRRMPRKSTYFTPKPRSGLLLAALS
ncbi:MAG TPA: DUF1015 family protein [Pseudonocardiaceae bacterium]|jgi:hypothetical protein|nr:DUF1015 family protein [Pseudonocardiaceae bacterium]